MYLTCCSYRKLIKGPNSLGKIRRKIMKKNLIIGVLVLCSMVLVVGSVFAIQTYSVKCSDVFLEDEGYNQKINDKKPDLKCSDYNPDTDYNNENNQEKSGDYLQGLIFAPMVIMEAVCENHEIISK